MEKFTKLDIIESLRLIMEAHVEHYKADFELDINLLLDAAKRRKTPLWKTGHFCGWHVPVEPGACRRRTFF